MSENPVIGSVVTLSNIGGGLQTPISPRVGITEAPPTSDIPPKLLPRNYYGLICDGSVNYVYNTEGFVDWRKLVQQKYLVTNKQRTQETDVTKLEDKDLLILLAGIRYLAQIRGY